MPTVDTAEAISGRATGVLFFAGFGSLWLCTGMAAMHRLNVFTGIGIAAILAMLILPAIQLLRQSPKAAPAAINDARELETKRVFNRVNSIQWVAIVAAVVLLNVFQQGDFIIPAIAAIVGLHLFPLARLFRYPAHYVTGTLLVVWSAVAVVMLPRQAIGSVGALGTAAVLLTSAAYTLVVAKRAARRFFVS